MRGRCRRLGTGTFARMMVAASALVLAPAPAGASPDEGTRPDAVDIAGAMQRFVGRALAVPGPCTLTTDTLFERLRRTLHTDADDIAFWPRQEYLLAVDQDCLVSAAARGGASDVAVGDVLATLSARGGMYFLIHNHPAGTSLSHADINLLRSPVVAGVVAIGHDRSVYAAGPGRAVERGDDASRRFAYVTARQRALQELIARTANGIDPDAQPGRTAEALLSHVIALGLGGAGVIEYRFQLGPWRHEAMQRCRVRCRAAAYLAGEAVQRLR